MAPLIQDKKRYDLPFVKDSLSQFQFVLTLILTVLFIWVMTGFFLAKNQAEQWASTLRNDVTIEIPAYTKDGEEVPTEQIQKYIGQTMSYLGNNKSVNEAELIDDNNVRKLLEPWLGALSQSEEIAYPKFISVTMKSSESSVLKTLEQDLEKISPLLKLSTDKEWLNDLFSLIHTAEFIAILIMGILLAVIIVSIAFSVKARMAILDDNIEILHLMGAVDSYIANQFMRQSFFVAIKSSLLGFITGFIVAFAIIAFVLPDNLDGAHYAYIKNSEILLLAAFPFIIAALSALTSRITALKILRAMP